MWFLRYSYGLLTTRLWESFLSTEVLLFNSLFTFRKYCFLQKTNLTHSTLEYVPLSEKTWNDIAFNQYANLYKV